MLQIKNIKKEYRTGKLVQKALDDVSLNLRDNEFVSILGPSGSGKTTLLNIIGGLDRYDAGDLIINGVSTKQYKDRDWDSYRNHTIGFIFQSYNLIPHQTILSNVELALTISGVPKEERQERAEKALQEVGLGDHIHKIPNQLSGGQMQRVAIARALVNNPDIILADEPTGALDSETSIQIMELLKDVAKDRLVVMVTHNPELAEEYSTRIVTLKDGKIINDNNPFIIDKSMSENAKHKNLGKTSMSFKTALSLSFNNLKTKKARTILTAFAGSIGIIGIALILSLSNGINNYISSIEEETLSEYPLQIRKSGYDMTSMFKDMNQSGDKDSSVGRNEVGVEEATFTMFSSVGSNDLKSLKKQIESNDLKIKKHTNGVEYDYGVVPQIYRENTSEGVRKVHPDNTYASMGMGSEATSNSMMSGMMSTDIFRQMPRNKKLYSKQYDLKAGKWPEKYNECVVVLTANGGIIDHMQYTLGLRDFDELDEMVEDFTKEEKVDIPTMRSSYDYDEIMNKKFKLVNQADCYQYDSEYNLWKDKTSDDDYMKKLIKDGEEIKVVGIIQPKEGASSYMLMPGIYYTPELEDYVVKESAKKDIVKDQLKDKETNVFTGKSFSASDERGGGFDMKSLFNIDPSQFSSAFNINPGSMGDINMDLGNFNNLMGDINLPPLDLGDIFSKLDIKVTQAQLNKLITELIAGYNEYSKGDAKMDFSNLDQQMQKYVNSSNLKNLIERKIKESVEEDGKVTFTEATIQEIVQSVLGNYYDFIADNNLPDIQNMRKYFMEYMKSDLAKEIINRNLKEIAASNNLEDQIYAILNDYMKTASASISGAIQKQIAASMGQLSSSMANALNFDTSMFTDAFQMDMSEQEIMELMTAMMYKEVDTYDTNLQKLGYAEYDNPSMISIYPKDFEEKEKVVEVLDSYNEDMEKSNQDDKIISYTDMVGSLMSSVTSIINSISYVLVAFVAISLIVSSIMIGVITYISVLERKKEIGVLRAIGASKSNISQVFNAETFIIGALSGIIGIGITLILIIPTNIIIHSVTDKAGINASLPILAGFILIIISTLLTLIGGIIPSRKAAKEDPVTALRTE